MLALLLLSVAVAIGVALLPRFPQPSSYHDFADQRTMWGVPHALNVFSNVGFLLVGALGLHRLHLRREGDRSVGDARPAYRLFLLSIVGVAFGSAYYHLEPNHERLFWDRLPMSLAFMSLLTCVLVERLGVNIGMRLFPWLAVAGPLSVVYWLFSERAGVGDLRPYAVVHFYSVLLILMLLALFPARWTRGGDFLVVLALYGAALASERLDHEIDAATGWISGHSLKHVFAALAAGWVIRMLRLRRPV
jgi:hypothetical protein